MMMVRGWKLFALLATIIVYIIGILVLSIVNLQTNPQKRMRNSRFLSDPEYHHNPEVSLLRQSPLHQLRWCTELKFMNTKSSPYKLKTGKTLPVEHVTFPKYSSSGSSTGSFSHMKNLQHDQQQNFKLESSSTISDIKNEFNESSKAIALSSFPGSGNTWLRYLLQQATGIYTGSVYKDYGLLKSGFPAENIANISVLIVKTHEYGPSAWVNFRKAVLLVRDPAKAILAEFNRQSGGHVGYASIDRYKRTNGRYWMKFVKTKLLAWEQTNLSWGLDYTGDVLIIYYENLVDNVEKTLRDILNFIEFPINEELLSCALRKKEGIYRRKKRFVNFQPYTTSMKKMIEKKRIQVYEELGRNKPKHNKV